MKPKRIFIRIAAFVICLTFSHCSNEIEFAKPYVKPVDNKFFQDGEVELVFENDRENGINVIFLGDGYIRENLGKEHGSYKKDGLLYLKTLFESPPFSEYKSHFNAYIVYVESQETGVQIDEKDKRTKFGGTFRYTCASGRSCLSIENFNAVQEYTEKINARSFQTNLVLMSVNESSGGSARLNGYVAIFGNSASPNIAIHEVGHAFAGLYDEYIVEDTSVEYNVANAPNLDITNDLEKIKWRHFIDLKDGNYRELGAFEGGGYQPFGVWRPDVNSVMRSAAINTFFNAPSREAIVRHIMSLRGIPFDFKAFLEVDKISISRIRAFSGRVNNTKQINHQSIDRYNCLPY